MALAMTIVVTRPSYDLHLYKSFTCRGRGKSDQISIINMQTENRRSNNILTVRFYTSFLAKTKVPFLLSFGRFTVAFPFFFASSRQTLLAEKDKFRLLADERKETFGTASTVSLLVWVLTTSLYQPIDAGNETASTIKVGTQNHRIDQI